MPKGIRKEELTPEQQKEQDKKDYLAYQQRISKQNEDKPDGAKIPILPKAEWIERKRPSGESKRDIFLRIVDIRVNTAIAGIENILPLRAYSPTEEEREKIISALEVAISETREKFLAEEAKVKGKFHL